MRCILLAALFISLSPSAWAQCTGFAVRVSESLGANINALSSNNLVAWNVTSAIDFPFVHNPAGDNTLICTEVENSMLGRLYLNYTGPSAISLEAQLRKYVNCPISFGTVTKAGCSGSEDLAGELIVSRVLGGGGDMLWPFVIRMEANDCIEVFVDRLSGGQAATLVPNLSSFQLTCLE